MSATVLEGPHTAAQERAEHTGRIHTSPETIVEPADDGGSGSGIPPRFPPVDEGSRDRSGRPEKPSRWVFILIALGALLMTAGLLELLKVGE